MHGDASIKQQNMFKISLDTCYDDIIRFKTIQIKLFQHYKIE